MKKILGYNDIKLYVNDEGNPNGPVLLFIHGFSQSSLSWKRQRCSSLKDDFRLVSIDIRGHGSSDKPQIADAYNNHLPFAHDIEAVLNYIDVNKVLPVCWSMGGNWICDYLREFGEKRLSGIFLVGASTQQGTPVTENFFGSGALQNLQGLFETDLQKNISATKNFVRACVSKPHSAQDFDEALAYNMIVSNEIREWMLGRISNNNDILLKLTLPIIQIHGSLDKIVLPCAGEYTIQNISHNEKELILYKGVGHSPFYETPNKFNLDLRKFAQKIF